MTNSARTFYPTGPETTPISAWHLWLPIFQKLGIDPANIPDFKPDLAPEGEGLPAWLRSGSYQAGLGAMMPSPGALRFRY